MTAPARRPARRLAAAGSILLGLAAACRPVVNSPAAEAVSPRVATSSAAPSVSPEAERVFSPASATSSPPESGEPPVAADTPADPASPIFALAEEDQRAALLVAEKLPITPGATHIRGVLLQRWAGRDFTAALAHADALPAGADREEMFGRLALVLAESLPAEAAAIVARDMRPGPARAEAAISVLHRWTLSDPAAAARWVAAFPAGPLRERAERELAGVATMPAGD